MIAYQYTHIDAHTKNHRRLHIHANLPIITNHDQCHVWHTNTMTNLVNVFDCNTSVCLCLAFQFTGTGVFRIDGCQCNDQMKWHELNAHSLHTRNRFTQTHTRATAPNQTRSQHSELRTVFVCVIVDILTRKKNVKNRLVRTKFFHHSFIPFVCTVYACFISRRRNKRAEKKL